ncbi:MAG: glycosyltransferase family 4 protein [Anaerolineae bacterium]
MKICVITGTFHPEIGGPPTYLYNLLGSLVDRGDEAAVITYGDDSEGHKYPYPVYRISRKQPVLLRLIKFIWQILLIAPRYKLLFVNDYGLPAAIANLILRKPLVMKIVGDFAWEYSVRHQLIAPDENIDTFQSGRHSPKVELLKRLQRFYINRAQVVIVPSRYFAQIVAAWGVPEPKIQIIYNAVDADKYDVPISKEEAKHYLGLNGKVILTIARLTPWKGVDKLIKLLPGIREEQPEAQLIVVGEGPEQTKLQHLAQKFDVAECVTFAGSVPNEEIPRYLRAADVFVLYSGYEGLSHTLLEALAVGVPVVASAKGGNGEVIRDGVNGYLVKWGDEERLRTSILKVLNDRELAQRFSKNSKSDIKQRFEWKALERRTLQLFEVTAAEG